MNFKGKKVSSTGRYFFHVPITILMLTRFVYGIHLIREDLVELTGQDCLTNETFYPFFRNNKCNRLKNVDY